jgi:hypothetical protein
MEKHKYVVPVAYTVDSGELPTIVPGVIIVKAQDRHNALLVAKSMLIEMGKEDQKNWEYEIPVWYEGKLEEQCDQVWEKYGYPDDFGYAMGDPVRVHILFGATDNLD